MLASPGFWILSTVFFGFFGTYLTFQGLWVTPYLMSTFGLERMLASELTMITAVGFMLGAPLGGWLADRVFGDRVRVLMWILIVQSLLWAALIWGPPFYGRQRPISRKHGRASGLSRFTRCQTPVICAYLSGDSSRLMEPAPPFS